MSHMHEANGGALEKYMAVLFVMLHMSQPRQWQQAESFRHEVNGGTTMDLADFYNVLSFVFLCDVFCWETSMPASSLYTLAVKQ